MTTETQEKMTLAKLLQALNEADNAVALDFDPESVVGELRDKIDAIHTVLTRLEGGETWCRNMAKPFQAKAKALQHNRERLEDYVVYTMQQQHFESLPGDMLMVRLRNNPTALKMLKGLPDALDYMNYPEYVEPIRGYAWRTDKIKEDLKTGKLVFPAPNEGEESKAFAMLTQGQRAEFIPNVPQSFETKKGKK